MKLKPIKTKSDADKYENWADRIRVRCAAFDKAREAEKAYFLEEGRKVDARYKPHLADWKPRVAGVKESVDGWVIRENRKFRDAAEAKARTDHAAEAARIEAERIEALRHNTEAQAANEELQKSDPVAFFTGSATELVEVPEAPIPVEDFKPVVAIDPVQVGTARKRTVKEAARSAVIANLEAAAIHLAKLQDPELIALIQKRANAAAKSGVEFPGCKFSTTQGAAA